MGKFRRRFKISRSNSSQNIPKSISESQLLPQSIVKTTDDDEDDDYYYEDNNTAKTVPIPSPIDTSTDFYTLHQQINSHPLQLSSRSMRKSSGRLASGTTTPSLQQQQQHSAEYNAGSTSPSLLQPLLTELPANKRWRDFITRGLTSILMIAGFLGILASGHLSVILMVVLIQTLVFKEVISIAHVPSKEKKLPWFRLINWYFLGVTNYYLYGELLTWHFRENVLIDAFLQPLAANHRFVSFLLYTIGFVFFVMNLKKGHYKFQFMQFFWTHMTLLVVVFQSHFILSNILEGLVWFILPVSLVIANDIFAYLGGFFMGRTRLIRLSPKKTWEGFIFGFICTLLISAVIVHLVVQSEYLICPAKDLSSNYWTDGHCKVNPIFLPVRYKLNPFLSALFTHLFRSETKFITIAPLYFHAFNMACFASIIAPFGGFFASGFKRAFKLKDFGDSIPGHGGITDRMDCQFIMGFFSYIYYATYIRTVDEGVTVASLLQTIIMGLESDKQMELYENFREYLSGQNLL